MMYEFRSVLSAHELTEVCESFRLAPRQREIAGCLLRGMADKQIAEVIGISLPTVRTHLSRMFEKLDVNDRNQLVLRFLHQFRDFNYPIDGDGNGNGDGDGHPH